MRVARAATRLLSSSALTLALLALAPAAQAATSYRQDLSFGASGTGPGQLTLPQGMAIDPADGELFVADTGDSRINVYAPDGSFSRSFGSIGTTPGLLAAPIAVAVSPVSNDVYVADSANNRVQRFTNAGAFVAEFGDGQVNQPNAIAFDHAGNVYVGVNTAIATFAADGTFQGNIPGGLAGFQQLGGLADAPPLTADTLFATDTQANTAGSFNLTGSAGTPYETGRLSSPRGLAVRATASNATIYVADRGNARVAYFGGSGPFLGSFGSFPNVSAVAYSYSAQRVYVLDGEKITTWQEVPTPALGKSMDIDVDSGTVLYKPPGAKKFARLKKVSLVKSGTIIDARRGTVGITSLTAAGKLQSADFYQGIFKAIQKKQGRGLTDAALFGANFKPCPKGLRAAKHVPQTIRKLWGSGSGQFRTKGRFASAAIRGTTWLTDDRCDGTLIRVTQGAVTVRDLVKNRMFVVKAGHQYFARAKRG